MEPRTFCDALNREAGDYLLATVLEGAAQGAQLLLCGGVPEKSHFHRTRGLCGRGRNEVCGVLPVRSGMSGFGHPHGGDEP